MRTIGSCAPVLELRGLPPAGAFSGPGIAAPFHGQYNPTFPRKLHGRILPAHFFCSGAFGAQICAEGATHLLMNWQDAIERTVTGLGYDLVETERAARGLLRVFIDRVANDPTGEFITVEDCEKVTRQLQHVLEVEGMSYERLEVSSPGLDRPLKKSADYARFAGHEVELTLRQPFQGRRKYRGVLTARESAEGWRVVFNDGKGDQALDFTLDEVREARLVPVLDFKGRRFSPGPGSAGQEEPRADDEVGGRKQ
jgi:ribosome maturation factor RimP